MTTGMSDVILYAIVPIVVVMLAGFIAGKRKVFSGADASKFNKVVLDFALPAALFVSIAKASREMLLDDLKLTLVAVLGIMGCFMLVYYMFRYCFKGNTGADGAIAALVSGSPTIGFLGFAVLEPIFGTSASVALVVAIASIVVNAIGIPVGLSLLNASIYKQSAGGSTHQRVSGWKPVIKALSQPVAWAPLLAVAWVMAGIPWPAWASPSFDLIAKANASLAVFAAGIILSTIKVSLNLQAVLGAIMKMVVMPAMILVIGLLSGLDAFNLKMLVVAGSLPPAFSGIIIADEYDRYMATGTSSLALSIVMFVFFCPLWIWLTDLAINFF